MKYVVAIAILSAALAANAGDVAAGKARSMICTSCHGANGISSSPMFPSLAGKKAEYLSQQLRDFKSGSRQNPSMSAMAAPLTPEDIENLAAYFSSLPAPIKPDSKTEPKACPQSKPSTASGDFLQVQGKNCAVESP